MTEVICALADFICGMAKALVDNPILLGLILLTWITRKYK